MFLIRVIMQYRHQICETSHVSPTEVFGWRQMTVAQKMKLLQGCMAKKYLVKNCSTNGSVWKLKMHLKKTNQLWCFKMATCNMAKKRTAFSKSYNSSNWWHTGKNTVFVYNFYKGLKKTVKENTCWIRYIYCKVFGKLFSCTNATKAVLAENVFTL